MLGLLPAVAQAGACCVGSTTAEGGRLGPCEFLTVGVATSLDARVGSWSRSGELHTGSDARVTHRWVGSAAVRPDRRVQVGVSVPFLLQWKRVSDVDGLGAGPGDTTIWATLEPFEDTPAPANAPLPDFGFALTLPTGVPVGAGETPVGSGATGSGHLVLTPSFRLGRSGFRGSLFGSASLGLSTPKPGGTKVPGAAWELALAGAWFARNDLSLSVSGGFRGLTPGVVNGRSAGSPSLEPWLGAGLALATRHEGRVTLGLRHSIPAPGIGRSQEVTVLFTLGVAYVTKRRPMPIGGPLEPSSPGPRARLPQGP